MINYKFRFTLENSLKLKIIGHNITFSQIKKIPTLLVAKQKYFGIVTITIQGN